ncbi:hypothetical protein HRbin36_02189 [bacterium HR36]|nr:hypothetical protein HRbin36_02189 [bacterium HR36]
MIVKLDDSAKDGAMSGVVKIIVLTDNLQHVADDAVVAQHAPQHRAFGIEILRREIFRWNTCGHHGLRHGQLSS